MNYGIFILPRARKELASLPKNIYERVCDAIRSLADDPRPPGCLKLAGREGRRLRVGDYRVLYTADDEAKAVVIYRIKIRSEATYK